MEVEAENGTCRAGGRVKKTKVVGVCSENRQVNNGSPNYRWVGRKYECSWAKG